MGSPFFMALTFKNRFTEILNVKDGKGKFAYSKSRLWR